MPYIKKVIRRMPVRRRHGFSGLGLDASGNNGAPMCALVAADDPYRQTPSNRCTNNQGDDTTIGESTDPITVKPIGGGGGAAAPGSSWLDKASSAAGNLLGGLFGKPAPGPSTTVVQTGPSTTTMVVIGAAALGAVLLLTRKKS